MPPTTQDLFIYIAGRNVTKKVDLKIGIRITEERGKRISQGSFTLKDGASLGLALWNVVLIISPDFSANYMWGYITDLKETKRAANILDYAIRVSRAEVRFSKAILNGTFTGTDAQILSSILSNAVPDLSGLFDFSSGVTALTADSLNFEANELTALDAIDKLAEEVGANWGWTMDDGARFNFCKNPALTNDADFYSGELDANSTASIAMAAAAPPAWNPANMAWGSGAGETGGGILLTPITQGVVRRAGMTIGRTTLSGTLAGFEVELADNDSTWLQLTIFVKSSLNSVNMRIDALRYDVDGNFLSVGTTANINLTTGWVQYFAALAIGPATGFPDNFLMDFVLSISETADYTINIDKVVVEVVTAKGAPLPAYFDGNTTNALWTGIDDESESLLLRDGKHQLDWAAAPSDAPFDLDIGTTDFVGDIDFNYAGLDGINHMIVIGGYGYVDVVWEFHANNKNVVFDLPVEMFPADGDSVIVVEENTGTDGTPIWTGRTVLERIGNSLAGTTVLWSQEHFYLEWSTAPPDLNRAFRVTARIKERIRATVSDDVDIANTGVTLADTIYDDTITTQADAHAAGFAALVARASALQVNFTTYEPGLKPNQEIDIADSVRAETKTVVIQKVTHKYLGGGFAQFDIVAGQRQDDLADIAVKTRKLAEEKPPLDATTSGQALDTILDGDLEEILDGNNQVIFQVT